MDELVFILEETPEGGFTIRLDESIFSEAEDIASLQEQEQEQLEGKL